MSATIQLGAAAQNRDAGKSIANGEICLGICRVGAMEACTSLTGECGSDPARTARKIPYEYDPRPALLWAHPMEHL